MRARRLTSIIVIALLGLGGLSACRVETGKAAFVGGTTFTEDRVTAIYEEAVADARKAVSSEPATGQPATAALPISRQEVVDVLVSLELGKRIVAANNYKSEAKPTDPKVIAEALQVPVGSEYTKLWTAWYDLQVTLLTSLPPAELTDEGIMEVYHALVDAGKINAGMTVAQVRETFGEAQFAQGAIMIITALKAEATKAKASINPKYQPLAAPQVVNTQQGSIFYNLTYINPDMVADVTVPETASPVPAS
jgi:hypothetical protein